MLHYVIHYVKKAITLCKEMLHYVKGMSIYMDIYTENKLKKLIK